MPANDIESKAEQVLKRSRVTRLPVPVERIAARHNILIRRARHSEFSGMLIRKDGRALIGVNCGEANVRQRFTIAHELGHFFLHPRKAAFVDYRDKKSGISRTPRERQANAFAAALLMPRRRLLRDFRALAKKELADRALWDLSRRYGVSEDAMRFRLINLGLIRPA